MSSKETFTNGNKCGAVIHGSEHSGTQQQLEQIMEENSCDDPTPSTSPTREHIQSQEVDKCLETFVSYLVYELEAKMDCYQLIISGGDLKAGKISDTFAGGTGRLLGGGIGGLLGATIGHTVLGVKCGAEVGKKTVENLISTLGKKKYAKKLINMLNLLEQFQKDKPSFRKWLVKTGFDAFQSFELQFMRVTTTIGHENALYLLAKDAANRIINCYSQNNFDGLTTAVLKGSSKVEPFLGVPVGDKFMTPGYYVKYNHAEYSFQWRTASLYEKAGITLEEIDKVYQRKYVESRPEKYGYRRPFFDEHWDELEEITQLSTPKDPFKAYKYHLRRSDLDQKVSQILEKINSKENVFTRKKIVEIMEEVKKDLLQEIKSLIANQELFTDTDRATFDEIKSNLESLKVEEFVGNVICEMEKMFEVSNAQNKIQYEQLDQKLDVVKSEVVQIRETTSNFLRQGVKVSEDCREQIWFDVRDPVPLFTGRTDELKKLQNAMLGNSEGENVTTEITAIIGLGGMGKTQLARKFIQVNRKTFNDVIWLNAESEHDLTMSFKRLVMDEVRYISTKDKHGKNKDIKLIIKDVYNYFSGRKCLFVFDNADKDEYLGQFLPLSAYGPNKTKPNVLITTRNCEWTKEGSYINLDKLELKDAIAFVREGFARTTYQPIDEESERLVKNLQCFPLAIQQAISYILYQAEVKVFYIDDYLELYDEKTKTLLDSIVSDALANDYKKTTFTTWKVTLDKIVTNPQYGSLAIKILSIISCLASENIYIAILQNIAAENELVEAIRLLKTYSLLNVNPKEETLNLHRLVQEVTRIELQMKEEIVEVLLETTSLLKDFYSITCNQVNFIKIRNLTLHFVQLLDHIVKRTEKYPDKSLKISLIDLLEMIGVSYVSLGIPKEAKKYLEKELEELKSFEETCSESLFKLANAYHNLGTVNCDLGNLNEAHEYYEKARKMKVELHGEISIELADTLIGLGIVYRNLGDFNEAYKFFDKALNIKKQLCEEDNFQLAPILDNIGLVYHDLGDLYKAHKYFEEALKINGKHYGVDHFQLADNLNNLSTIYRQVGDSKKSAELLQKALDISQQHYGENHYKLADALTNLGRVSIDLGDLTRAKEVCELSFTIIKSKYGAHHIKLAHTLNTLGEVYLVLGDLGKAVEHFQQALEIKRKYYGLRHFKRADTLFYLVIVSNQSDNRDEAEKYLSDCGNVEIDNFLKVVISFISSRCICHIVDYLDEAVKSFEEQGGHFKLATAYYNCGNIFRALRSLQNAQECFEKALKIFKGNFEVSDKKLNNSITSHFQKIL